MDVDGDRPAVAWVTSLPADWTTPRERLVLMLLALDTYDRRPPFRCRPRMAWLAAWSGEHRQRISEAVSALASATATRPALLQREGSNSGKNGRAGNRYVLLTEVSAMPDASREEMSAELSGEVSAEVSAQPDNLPSPLPLPSSDSLRSSASTLPRRRPIDDGIDPESDDPYTRFDAVEWYLDADHGLKLADVDGYTADRLAEASSMHPKAIANVLAQEVRVALARRPSVRTGHVSDAHNDPWRAAQ
ncbi:hypothetical protein ASE19_07620 [Nocardioides sp. Root79]|nr:hypothetical protein ASE19_07620 [Nocardioides sp. Root79]KRC71276.1 hypothetical protein ASE20_10035 [Nocardioides sp. Root240]